LDQNGFEPLDGKEKKGEISRKIFGTGDKRRITE
jgi:hypothetical protein